jgi:GNAT superfamily N-acetyltransferase
MRLAEFHELNEAPDYNYTKFNNRDEDIKTIEWEIVSTNAGLTITAWDPNLPKYYYSFAGRIRALAEHDYVHIISIKIKPKWHGTGLGQLLYDKAITQAKIDGHKYFRSDYGNYISAMAQKAWERLSQRYPVKKVMSKGKLRYYQIDLSKIHATK